MNKNEKKNKKLKNWKNEKNKQMRTNVKNKNEMPAWKQKETIFWFIFWFLLFDSCPTKTTLKNSDSETS